MEAERPRETPPRAAQEETASLEKAAPTEEAPLVSPEATAAEAKRLDEAILDHYAANPEPAGIVIHGVRTPEKKEIVVPTSLTRCPYCHSDVSPDHNDWVVCRDCLARHHTACWWEGGKKCATCGKRKYLSAAAPKQGSREPRLPFRPPLAPSSLGGPLLTGLARVVLALVVVAGVLFGAILAFAAVVHAPQIAVPLLAGAIGLLALRAHSRRMHSISHEEWWERRRARQLAEQARADRPPTS
ncbi:hypothetical protein HY251_13755 [bacterium]|nr:hypothetical protein [bacterium]